MSKKLTPTKRKPILARHVSRKGPDGKPLMAIFSRKSWKNLPDGYVGEDRLKKMGYVLVEDIQNPKPAPAEAKSGNDEASTTKPTKKSKTLESKVEVAIRTDDSSKVTVKDMKTYADENSIDLDVAQPKSDIFKDLKAILAKNEGENE